MCINNQCPCRGSRHQQWQRRWGEVDWVVAASCETDLSLFSFNYTSFNKLNTSRFNSSRKVSVSILEHLFIIRGATSPRVPPRCTSVDFTAIWYQQRITCLRFVLMRFILSRIRWYVLVRYKKRTPTYKRTEWLKRLESEMSETNLVNDVKNG